MIAAHTPINAYMYFLYFGSLVLISIHQYLSNLRIDKIDLE